MFFFSLEVLKPEDYNKKMYLFFLLHVFITPQHYKEWN